MTKKITPDEVELIGRWELINGRVVGDETCTKIEELVANHFEEITSDQTGWDTLYQNPEDNRYWELTYPQSHMQGGGPPVLTCISENEARKKYELGGNK